MEIVKCQPSLSKPSVTACILLMVFFHLKKLLGRFQKDPLLHIVGGIFILSQEHRLHGKGPPRAPQLSFTSQRGFLLLPPPGTPTDKRRIKTSRQTPQERASHSHVPMGCVQKSWSGKGSPRQAGGDGDDQGRRVTHAQSRCRDSRAGARTHAPELPILFTLCFSSAAGSGIRFENRLQLQNPKGGPRKKKKIPRCPRNQSESCTCLQAASAEQTGLRDQRGPGPLLPSGLATRLARSHLQAQRA